MKSRKCEAISDGKWEEEPGKIPRDMAMVPQALSVGYR